MLTAEHIRLQEDEREEKNWKRWGPYLSERQWGTVREDYSEDGDVWNSFPHDHARSRAYRWGEDGLLGLTDRQCRICFAVALWNEKDSILKERLFGLTGPQGNHGEDVKEQYFYLDATPTHSYQKALYKYPQAAFPYKELVRENARRGKTDPEFELMDTGAFDDDRYFDVQVEYAKADAEDILIRLTITNRGPDAAPIHVLPTVWFRNSWSWGCRHEGCEEKPSLRRSGPGEIALKHKPLGDYSFVIDQTDATAPTWLFTDNETNARRLWGDENGSLWTRDAFHDYVVDGRADAVCPDGCGTKAAPHLHWVLPAGESRTIRLRLSRSAEESDGSGRSLLASSSPFADFDAVFADRITEADAFYASVIPAAVDPEFRNVMRQAYAGLLWSKQFYHYIVSDWLGGDRNQPKPPKSRQSGRNHEWAHLYNRDVISVPDKWEYPWYASWDLAFHMIPLCDVDPAFAKQQLVLFLREWYMHPNGQIPAYEFALGDVNPPVHAWACWQVYKKTAPPGQRDTRFLERVFQKLLINFTWWVNRKDPEGRHLFSGGFLGLDNIGVFDRSRPLPGGGRLLQADGTAWMAFYCTTMLSMALELARDNPGYEDVAFKFFRHFIDISAAINSVDGHGLWDEEDGFYFDRIQQGGDSDPVKIRSLVGLLPLIAVAVLEEAEARALPDFWKRVDWFLKHREDLAGSTSYMETGPAEGKLLLAIPSRERLERLLGHLFDERGFLSQFGIRSLSRYHEEDPFEFRLEGEFHRVAYAPGEGDSDLFGGNSNWRGPVWFPINYLIAEALERYHSFYGDSITVACPTGSANRIGLDAAAREISRRHTLLFRSAAGGRPSAGNHPFAEDPHWRDHVLFHEYFHAETGKGLGASHQTGWTSLIARFMCKAPDGSRVQPSD